MKAVAMALPSTSFSRIPGTVSVLELLTYREQKSQGPGQPRTLGHLDPLARDLLVMCGWARISVRTPMCT